MSQNLPKHLGGHYNITHIDDGALTYLVNKFNIKTMYDIGCGPGGMVSLAKSKGIDSTGIDGDFTIQYPTDLQIIIHDFTTGPLLLPLSDLGWSCEFLEHVAEKYMDHYFSVFSVCKIICCTFATIYSKKGHHHVNLKNQKYWDNKFLEYGFVKDIDSTNDIKKYSTMQRNFIRNTGTIYINKKY